MKHELTSRRKERRIMAVWTSLVLTTALFTTSAFAADSDPLTIVNNLSDFIFSCIKAIGIIILGWGVVQLGTADIRADFPVHLNKLCIDCFHGAAAGVVDDMDDFIKLSRIMG